MTATTTWLAREAGFSTDGFRLMLHCFEGAGRSVLYLHLQLLGARRFDWPPG
jgi:histidine triad (HIT) family protein